MRSCGKFLSYIAYQITGRYYNELIIMGSAFSRSILTLIWIHHLAYIIFDVKIDSSCLESLPSSLLLFQFLCEWSTSRRDDVDQVSWFSSIGAWISMLALSFNLTMYFKSLVLSGSTFSDCILLLWPYITSILASFRFFSNTWIPRYSSRFNLIVDTYFTYIICSALIRCLLLRKGATVFIIAELCSSALILIVSLSRLAQGILLEIRIQLSFPKLTQNEVAALADDDLCTICLEQHSTQSCRLICSHIVHVACLVSVLQSRRPGQESQCPVCRAPIFGNNSQRDSNPFSESQDATSRSADVRTASSVVATAAVTPPSFDVQTPSLENTNSIEQTRHSRPLLIDRIPWNHQTIFLDEPLPQNIEIISEESESSSVRANENPESDYSSFEEEYLEEELRNHETLSGQKRRYDGPREDGSLPKKKVVEEVPQYS